MRHNRGTAIMAGRVAVSTTLTVLALSVCVSAGRDSVPDPDVRIAGFGSWELGQIVRGFHEDKTIDHAWQQFTLAHLDIHADYGRRMRAVVGVEAKTWIPFIREEANWSTKQSTFTPYLHQAQGVFDLVGEPERPALRLAAGLMPIKYNPQARNLGEYLFRTRAYPTIILSEFDFPAARLPGLRLSSTLFGSLTQDLLLFSERDLEPYYDFSCAWMGAYDIAGAGILTLGAGISLEHLLPVDEELTTPRRPYQNLYIENPDTLDDGGTVVGDSGYYTFRSTKVMGRLSFDPKRMWTDDDAEDNGIFGTEDLKLYAEGAVLGLKDYPANESQNNPGYEDIMERIPVMVGFNVPAFRVLDMLSLELQWFGSRAPNSYNKVMFSTTLPRASSGSTPEQYTRDDIKWSVYARKTLFGFCTLTGQIASDHLRTEKVGIEHIDTEENLREPHNWYWRVKAAFAFQPAGETP